MGTKWHPIKNPRPPFWQPLSLYVLIRSMSRLVKQLLYGAFYLILLILIVWGGIALFSGEKPRVVENGESSTDYKPLRILGGLEVFQLESGDVSVFARVQNPNEEVDARFDYRVVLFGEKGVLGEVNGRGVAFAGDVFYIAGLVSNQPKVTRVELQGFDVDWIKTGEIDKPNITFQNASARLESGEIVINGVVKNEGLLSGFDVEVVMLLKDRFSFPVFAVKSTIRDFSSREEKNFSITFPEDPELTRAVMDNTEFYLNFKP